MLRYAKTFLLSLLLIAFLAVSTAAQSQLIGDLNADHVVNFKDVQAFAWQWLAPGCLTSGCTADLDSVDGVNMADFALLAKNWQVVDPHVVISEFMASNTSSEPLEEGELLDGNGDSSDWIEIYNPTDTAVNLDGWYLTNNNSNLTKWQFPNGPQVEPGEFLIVFASQKTYEENPLNYPYLDSLGYYHTNFNLEQNGDYLALVAADGITIAHEYAAQYPKQLTDVSYGLAQYATTLVPTSAISSYQVPTSGEASLGTGWADFDFDDSTWATQPTTNLHFGDICGIKGLNYEYFEGYWSWVPDFDYYTPIREDIIDTFDITPRLRDDYFGFRFTGFIEVPLNGVYTFYTTSDDGSLLFIDDYLVVYNDGTHSMIESSGSIYLNAGMHPIKVEYFERDGGEGLIVSYDGPGIPKKTIPYDVLCSGKITNDMQIQMQYSNASLWTRIEFEVEDPDVFDMLVLRIRYEDGFMVYLNGQEVAWRNAPDLLIWDSEAESDRPIEDSSVFEEINLMAYLDLLLPKPQKNVLAIHGLNDNKNNGEFRILPEL
ncbi:MAG: PA14 domain-containing protein, partial [Sedimentisphaerales bacterium]